tara:strand:+ start:190 stop:696 length:507 start_codon:yes stop_codon:yes gene_type:complete
MSTDQLSMFEEENAAAEAPAAKFKSFNVSISRTLPVSAEKIFDRWLIPTFVGNWMFGNHLGNEKVIDLQNEVRPGGSYNYRIKRNGKEVLQDGEYLHIDRPNRLSFSWRETAKKNAHKSKVNLSLDPQEGKTKLKLTLQIDQTLEHYGDEIKQQWSERLKALSNQLSK